jgi:hypothetical protein
MLHVPARPEINSVKDLNGKKVNVMPKGSASSALVRKAFKMLDVEMNEANLTIADALHEMRAGTVYATAYYCPSRFPHFAEAGGDYGRAGPSSGRGSAAYATQTHQSCSDTANPKQGEPTPPKGSACPEFFGPYHNRRRYMPTFRRARLFNAEITTAVGRRCVLAGHARNRAKHVILCSAPPRRFPRGTHHCSTKRSAAQTSAGKTENAIDRASVPAEAFIKRVRRGYRLPRSGGRDGPRARQRADPECLRQLQRRHRRFCPDVRGTASEHAARVREALPGSKDALVFPLNLICHKGVAAQDSAIVALMMIETAYLAAVLAGRAIKRRDVQRGALLGAARLTPAAHHGAQMEIAINNKATSDDAARSIKAISR